MDLTSVISLRDDRRTASGLALPFLCFACKEVDALSLIADSIEHDMWNETMNYSILLLCYMPNAVYALGS